LDGLLRLDLGGGAISPRLGVPGLSGDHLRPCRGVQLDLAWRAIDANEDVGDLADFVGSHPRGTGLTAWPAAGRGAIGKWLDFVRIRVEQRAPQLLILFDTYAGEARFGRSFVEADLSGLPADARVLEIGAGALLLSCQLCREGFDVTALEPIGQGFSHFGQLQEIVKECAEIESCLPHLLVCPAEKLVAPGAFNYVFSINAMEHVADWHVVLLRVMACLKTGAHYRFTCPNYLFPYEPHFNIPTLFSKRLTGLVLGSRIWGNRSMPDPEGTWLSLNWITLPAVSAAVRRMPGIRIGFNKQTLVTTLARAIDDPEFSSRRSGWLMGFLRIVVRLRLHRLAGIIPVAMQPIMDCTLTLVGSREPRREE
ncbi:MAG: hypothetical protein NT123_24995, partial [Proteobacteria bacterium]|nr:hypothetical protein [Pseudomonadota bacterium]